MKSAIWIFDDLFGLFFSVRVFRSRKQMFVLETSNSAPENECSIGEQTGRKPALQIQEKHERTREA